MSSHVKRRGDTWVFDLPLRQPGGAPFALDGATVRFTMKRRTSLADDADGVIRKYWIDGGSSDGIEVDDPATGDVVITVEASETEDLALTRYRFNVQVTDANGDTWTPDSGVIVVSDDVTLTRP